MAGNILISFNEESTMRVDFSGDKQSMFKLNDVDLMRALMALEGMFTAQTGLSVNETRELVDDERQHVEVKTV